MKAVIELTQGPHARLSVIIGDIAVDDGEQPPGHLANVTIPGLDYTVEFASLIRIKRPIVYYREAFRQSKGVFGENTGIDPRQK